MICHERKIIFIHIGRTGGTSIELAFNKALQTHPTYTDIIRDVGQELWDQYFKFSFVRNPWERLLSAYLFLVRSSILSSIVANLKLDLDHCRTFQTWLKTVHKKYPTGEALMVSDRPLFETQSYWIYDGKKIVVDYLGRFEHLQHDFDEICHQRNLNLSLPHINNTDHRHYSYYYDEELKEIAAKWYAEDIKRFGYSFENKIIRMV